MFRNTLGSNTLFKSHLNSYAYAFIFITFYSIKEKYHEKYSNATLKWNWPTILQWWWWRAEDFFLMMRNHINMAIDFPKWAIYIWRSSASCYPPPSRYLCQLSGLSEPGSRGPPDFGRSANSWTIFHYLNQGPIIPTTLLLAPPTEFSDLPTTLIIRQTGNVGVLEWPRN